MVSKTPCPSVPDPMAAACHNLPDISEKEALLELIGQPVFYALGAAVTAWAFWHFGMNSAGIAAAIFGVFLLGLSLIDLRYYILPDILVLPGLALGVTLAPWFLPIDYTHSWLGAAFGFGFFWLIFWGFYKLRGYYGMGYGDVKLLGMLGAWTGVLSLPILLLISCAAALPTFGVRRLLYGTAASHPLPYGPFLALGAWLSLLYGGYLWQGLFAFRAWVSQGILASSLAGGS